MEIEVDELLEGLSAFLRRPELIVTLRKQDDTEDLKREVARYRGLYQKELFEKQKLLIDAVQHEQKLMELKELLIRLGASKKDLKKYFN